MSNDTPITLLRELRAKMDPATQINLNFGDQCIERIDRCLAERVDDGELVTEEWIRADGFTNRVVHGMPDDVFKRHIGCSGVSVQWGRNSKILSLGIGAIGMNIANRPATRSDVRELLRLLGEKSI